MNISDLIPKPCALDAKNQCPECGLTWHDGRTGCSHIIRLGENEKVVTIPEDPK